MSRLKGTKVYIKMELKRKNATQMEDYQDFSIKKTLNRARSS
jgi:hypothetical protein